MEKVIKIPTVYLEDRVHRITVNPRGVRKKNNAGKHFSRKFTLSERKDEDLAVVREWLYNRFRPK